MENNVVAGNARGFFIYDAEYNTLRGNLVVDNIVGVHLSAGSINNQVEAQRLHRQPRAGALRRRARRSLGRQGGQLLEQLHRLGPRRRRHRRRALRGQRHGRPPDLAPPDDEAAAGQPGGADAAPGRPAVPAAARAQRRRRATRACSPDTHELERLAWQVLTPVDADSREAGRQRAASPNTMARCMPSTAWTSTSRRGEMFGLIGHNGAGKSTLFKMMLGLIAATSGEIRIDGAPVLGRGLSRGAPQHRLPAGKRRALRQPDRPGNPALLRAAEGRAAAANAPSRARARRSGARRQAARARIFQGHAPAPRLCPGAAGPAADAVPRRADHRPGSARPSATSTPSCASCRARA